jgi:hypothetical protein
VTFDPRFLDSQERDSFEEAIVPISVAWAQCAPTHNTYATDQTLGILIHRTIFRELKFILEYPQIHVGVIVSPEGGLRRMVSRWISLESGEGPYNTGQHLIQHRSETPPVDFETVREPLDDLRSEVLGRATERACCLRSSAGDSIWQIFLRVGRLRGHRWEELPARTIRSRGSGDGVGSARELLRETEIRQNDMPIRTDEHVLWFKVSVDDSVLVKTFDTLDNLGGVEAGPIAT